MFFRNLFRKDECIICYSFNGKTDREEMLEMSMGAKSSAFPMKPLSDVYGCKCVSLCHSRCLIQIDKCPTCRKQNKPNLYIKTSYDYYLYYLLEWLKNDTNNVGKLKKISCAMILLFIIICFMLDKNYISIKHNNTINLIGSIIFALIYSGALYIIVIIDYVYKYWLYDEKRKKYHVFN